MIRTVSIEDAKDIHGIYNFYIKNTIITFETEPISINEMRERILEISGSYPYLVFEESGKIYGYCYASGWKKKKAYQHTVEITIYVDPNLHRKGIGSALMNTLLEKLRIIHVHAVIACISLPNPPSVKLHEKFGFTQVSHYREVGFKFNRWIDVGDWELIL